MPVSEGCGAIMSLVAKGAQDKYMSEAPELWDIGKIFLKNTHQVVYEEIQTTRKTWNTHISFTINRQCELINKLDLVISNPENVSINKLIKKIEVEFGGQRMDCLNIGDLHTQILTNCAIFGRTMSHINGKTFIPLTMAPLHGNNLVMPSSKWHDLKILIDFVDERCSDTVQIYGNKYYLEMKDRQDLSNKDHALITTQNQHYGTDRIKKGVNRFKLSYNHPVYMMYFWGFDKSKVTKVVLQLNGVDFYNGPIEPLEHLKLSRGHNVEPTFIYFSHDDIHKPTQSSVNFSRIDDATLWIYTEEEEERDIYIVGLNMQPLRYANGLVGLAFSK
jgi:hypothetical protein